MKRAGSVALLTGLLATLEAGATPGVPCEFYGINAGAPVWSGTVVLDPAYAQKLAATGSRSVRIDFLLDDQLTWNETALGRYDAVIAAALAAGLEPLGAMNYGAVSQGQAQWNDDADGDGMNPYVDTFAASSKILFSRYAGKVARWEIWNEPNCWNNASYASDPKNAGCSYILPRVYAKLLAEVYVQNEALLKQSGIQLSTGGLFAHDIAGSWSPASDYMTEVYAHGVWDWMAANKGRRYPWDFFGYHLYVDQGEQTDGKKLSDYLNELRALATSKQDTSPFLLTEVGWTTDSVSESIVATNLGKSFGLFEQRSDVSRVYWFTYQDFPNGAWGVVKSDGTPKAALAALQTAAAGCTAQSSGGTGGSAGAAGAASGGAAGTGGASPSGGTGGAGGVGATGGAASGGAPGSGGAAAATGSTSEADDSGCGCRTRSRGSASWAALVLFALAWVGRRR